MSELRVVRRAPDNPPNLRIGDTVRLNSGGPDMLVYDFDDSGNAMCNWLCGVTMQRYTWRPICLTWVPRNTDPGNAD